MSGRKAWEVASVLDEVEKIFDDIVGKYRSEISSNLSIVDKMKNKTGDAENKIAKLNDNELKKELSSFREWFERGEKIKSEVSEIFKNIEQNKTLSKNLRQKINNSNNGWYMNEEYAEAQKIKNSLNSSKNRLLRLKNESLDLKNSSQKLDTVLKNIDDLYNAKKRYLNKLYEEVSSRFGKRKLTKLEDFVDGIDVKVSYCEYYDHYKNSKITSEIRKQLSHAHQLLSQEKFTEAETELKKINEKLNEIFAEVDRLRENIESSFALTLKLRDLMSDEINFREVEIQLIDDNPANGFKLICKNGDTLIFDEIKVEDGEVKVNLNHIEKVGGSCGVRWKEMKKVLNKNGIPLVDVKKNGRSVIFDGRIKDKRQEMQKRKGK